MISDAVLIDTGPLVALLSQSDQYHNIATLQAQNLLGPVYTSWPVVTEAAWLLRHTRKGMSRLMQTINDRNIVCLHLDSQSLHWLAEAADQYLDLAPQLADLSLLYLAKSHEVKHIFTFDRRDFAVFRTSAGVSFELLPAEF